MSENCVGSEDSGETGGAANVLLTQLQQRYTQAWQAGGRVRIEELLKGVDQGQFGVILVGLVGHEVELRWKRGVPEGLEAEYAARFPEHAESIAAVISQLRKDLPQALQPSGAAAPAVRRKSLPECAAALDRMWSAFDEPPDLAGWLSGSAAGASPDDILAGLRLDQRRRWKTKSPWLVEAYIERLPLPSGMN
jgi:hypothetical protein